jgi:4-amino-4-deoxy-L-arabinose transferase-like glycosyltransferase
MNQTTGKIFPLLIWAGILLNATCLLNEVLEPDGALYAAIAKHIAITNDWVNLFGDGHDWLDKPHLPFWLAALSFKCLGITAFAYKLPAFLCWLLGVYYTYQLAKLLYGKPAAQLAVIIYITALHTVLANFDVRAEAYLTCFVVAAMYHLLKPGLTNWSPHLPVAAFYCALAVMTKGIFVLITITGGFVLYWMVTGQWKQLLAPRWWLVLLLTLLFITPELYCLYSQFDHHPEKIVFGRTQVSGIRFFFWDSQFGRFFNNGPIKGEGDPFFFLHTLLWAFLPWSVLLYIAVINLFRKKQVMHDSRHWIIWGCAGISFLLFSLSRFQLPHYIVIVFPQFAMMVAAYLLRQEQRPSMRWISGVQHGLFALLVVLVLALCWFSRIGNAYAASVLVAAALLVMLAGFRKASLAAVTGRNVCFTALLFLFLNFLFYPRLMLYQAGMQAGKWLQQHAPAKQAVMFRCNTYSFELYAPGLVARAGDAEDLSNLCQSNGQLMVYLPEKEWPSLQKTGLQVQPLEVFDYFHVSQLNGKFLNPVTRPSRLEKFLLARVTK